MFDIILVDTGAGLSRTVLGFVLADDVILVTTPEPTSITDAYALIKMVVKEKQAHQGHSEQPNPQKKPKISRTN